MKRKWIGAGLGSLIPLTLSAVALQTPEAEGEGALDQRFASSASGLRPPGSRPCGGRASMEAGIEKPVRP